MEAGNLQIYWHESQPIYSLCFQKSAQSNKLITAGGDNKIRFWNLNLNKETSKIDTIDFLTSLNQHEQAINAVRFNPAGDILASAGDDGQLLLWKQNDVSQKQNDSKLNTNIQDLEAKNDDGNENESWFVFKRMNYQKTMSSEIYDIAWSPDGNYILTGSMDNSLRIFDVNLNKQLIMVNDNTHYVQGVSWDPQNKFIFVQSADRSLSVYELLFDKETNKLNDLKLKNKIWKCDLPRHVIDEVTNKSRLDYTLTRSSYLFQNETLPSFFRRLDISPCGNLIGVPAGVFRPATSEVHTPISSNSNPELSNAVYIYSRGYLSKNSNKPILRIPFLKKPAVVVSFNPNLFKLNGHEKAYIKLPYKVIFAIATTTEVLIYDTESTKPISVIGNLHYTPLTDLAWSADGNLLMISSSDGFISYISIKDNLFGEKLSSEEKGKILKLNKVIPDKEAPSNNGETTEAKEKPNPVINILTIKRKKSETNSENSTKKFKNQPSPFNQSASPQQTLSIPIYNSANGSKQNTPSKEKKRIQPTLLQLDSKAKISQVESSSKTNNRLQFSTLSKPLEDQSESKSDPTQTPKSEPNESIETSQIPDHKDSIETNTLHKQEKVIKNEQEPRSLEQIEPKELEDIVIEIDNEED